jgi:hypothetical protein
MARLTKALQLVAARRVLGFVSTAELQDLAQDLLTDDVLRTEAVRALASRDLLYLEDALALFDEAIVQLGLIWPTPVQAALTLTVETCQKLLAGAHTPQEACQAIAKYSRAVDTRLERLDPFVYADSSLDDAEAFSGDELSELHASVLQEARDFLNALAP